MHRGQIGVLIELETDDEVVVRTDEFRRLARDLAIHVAARAPVGIRPVPLGDLPRGSLFGLGPAPDLPTLLTQSYVRDDRMTVAQRIALAEQALAAAIVVRRFVRFAVDDS